MTAIATTLLAFARRVPPGRRRLVTVRVPAPMDLGAVIVEHWLRDIVRVRIVSPKTRLGSQVIARAFPWRPLRLAIENLHPTAAMSVTGVVEATEIR
jgi:hypothetical protein